MPETATAETVNDTATEGELTPPADTTEVVEQTETEVPLSDGNETSPESTETPAFSPDDLDDSAWEAILAHQKVKEREEQREARARESERQLEQNRMRKEAGKKENIVRSVQGWMQRAGVDPNATIHDRSAPEFFYDLAHTNATEDVLKGVAQAALASFDAPEDVKDALMQGLDDAQTMGDLLARTDRIFKTSIDAAKGKAVADLTLSEVPESSKLHESIQAHIDSEVKRLHDAEVKAMKIEAASKDAPKELPNMPKGGAGSSGRHDLGTMIGITRAVRAGQLTEEEGRRRMNEL